MLDNPADLPRLTRSAPAPKAGIVHLGLGAFYRAFGAVYIQEAMNASGGDWGIIGVSLRSPGTRDALAPQDGVYTSVTQGPEGETAELIESVVELLVAPEDPAALLARLSDPAIKLVTLTVTEKGYCYEPATGRLLMDHPDIAHDLAHDIPRSAPGYLMRALQARRAAGVAPFTVLSCDNLPNNGEVTQGVVLELARAVDPDLADWIEAEGAFPSSMIDRITPATKDEDIARIAKMTGRYDAAPVVHEPFRQWVIEDRFVGGARPDFAIAGAQMVEDVTPFEHMKLRMLNGTHSSLAYLGYLAGHETIAETVADPVFDHFVQGLWSSEIIPVLDTPPGEDLPSYAAALLERYRNPAIRHRTWQIAMDGSQKLPQRILGTIAEAQAAGHDCPGLMLAVAAWMRYVGGVDESGGAIDVRDPLAERLKALSDAAEDPAEKVRALLSVRDVFSEAQAAAMEPALIPAYEALIAKGARQSIADLPQ